MITSTLQYTWNNDRLWRKNRRPGTICDGVDLNRNYNDHWGGVSDSDHWGGASDSDHWGGASDSDHWGGASDSDHWGG